MTENEQQANVETAQPAEAPQETVAPAHDKKAKLAGEVAAAKAKCEAAEKQAAEAKDLYLRTAAEYENFRKRSAREQEGAFNNGVGFAVSQLLNVLDTLTLAATAETQDENYKKGVVLTLDKANEVFAKLNVTPIEAQGAAFDPELHAAVLQQPAPEGTESGTVLQVLQAGYKIGDKVLRHATVIVAE